MTKLEELFKSELGTQEPALFDCPHCDHAILKSEVLVKGKGIPDLEAARQKGVDALGGVKPNPKPKEPKKVTKAGDVAEIDDDIDKADASPAPAPKPAPAPSLAGAGAGQIVSTPKAPEKTPPVMKSQYVEWSQGDDEAVADMIAKGGVGQGALVTQPIDKNWRKQ